MKRIYLNRLSALPKMFVDYILHNEVNSILDFGCSCCFWFDVLQKNRLLPKTAVGVDADCEACQDAVHNIQNINVVHGDITKLKFPDKPFDLAVCNQAIEDTGDWEAVAQNLYDSLREGGVLYISSIVRERGAWYFNRYNGEVRLSPLHPKEFSSLNEFTALLKRHGFHIMQARAPQFWMKWWSAPVFKDRLGIPVPRFKRCEALCMKPYQSTQSKGTETK